MGGGLPSPTPAENSPAQGLGRRFLCIAGTTYPDERLRRGEQ